MFRTVSAAGSLSGDESRGLLAAIFASAVDAIIVIDEHGRIEAFNPAAERLFGYTEHETLGHNVGLLMPQADRDEHDGYIARYLATCEKRIIGIGREVVALRRDGTTFPAHISVGEMQIEGRRKFVGILHDFTERAAHLAELHEQSALKRLGEMAAVVAHEVKNPLAAIRGAIEVIGGRLPADSNDAVVVKEIVSRIDALNDLMNEMLLFARPPQPRLAPMDPLALSKLVADLARQDPALRAIHIGVAGSSTLINGDARLLTIVLQNLLLNAAQAMPGGGEIRVTVTSADRTCRIEVADSGPGMPAHVREKLFTPFFTTKARGTGLGLSTAKRLLEAHDGTIAVDCPAAGGTTVTVALPKR
jgi:two-component system, LuxR family, sensor kinase FixL